MVGEIDSSPRVVSRTVISSTATLEELRLVNLA